ncbi:MAG TPA: heme ABC transporter ATP-binding protein, partial [Spirochaetia bacterium]|nr:heme ABC transporter ATP-binding protein [Spirochaetia bacterium]
QQRMRYLSGGNQQKVIISREVSHDPEVVVAAQPTRGLDIGATDYVHSLLLRLQDEGKAILLISADLTEITRLSDRIAVLYEGRIMGMRPKDRFPREEIGLLMAGKEGAQDSAEGE